MVFCSVWHFDVFHQVRELFQLYKGIPVYASFIKVSFKWMVFLEFLIYIVCVLLVGMF